MNIIEKRNKFITNLEVLEHLRLTSEELIAPPHSDDGNYHKMNNSIIDYEILAKELILYCEKTPAKNQTTEKIAQILEELSQYELEVIEKFQIVNLVPRNIVNLYSIVEECDLRFSEEQCDNIIAMLVKHFPEEFQESEEADIVEFDGEPGVGEVETEEAAEEYYDEEMEEQGNDDLVGDAGNTHVEDYEGGED